MSVSRRITVDSLRSPAELETVQEFWARHCRHRDADFAFYSMIVSSIPGASPHVLRLHRDGTTEALLVGRVELANIGVRVGYIRIPMPRLRTLELIHGGDLGPIGAEQAEAAAAHIIAMLRRREVDAVRLQAMDVASPLYRILAGLPGLLSRDWAQVVQPHWCRDMASPSADPPGKSVQNKTFLGTMSTKQRTNYRRSEKRLLEEYSGAVRIEAFRDEASLRRLMDNAEQVVEKSYQSRIGVGFRSTEAMRNRLAFIARNGWLRAWVLYLADKPAAYWIGTLREGTFLSDYNAYDAALSRFAPGTYLAINALEELHDKSSGVRRIDFGSGDAEYKARFGTEMREVATIQLFAPTLKGLWVNCARTGVHAANSAAKTVLAKAGLINRVKRWMRRARPG